MSKRADGELELEVLHILWGSEQPLHIGEVQELLEGNLAYTSVATVLARLTTKLRISLLFLTENTTLKVVVFKRVAFCIFWQFI